MIACSKGRYNLNDLTEKQNKTSLKTTLVHQQAYSIDFSNLYIFFVYLCVKSVTIVHFKQ